MTTRQPRACEPNRRHGGARRRGGSTSTRRRMRPQQGRQDRGTAELKLLQFPRPVSGRRPNTNFKKKQAPRKQQVLRYLNLKFYTTPISSSTLHQPKRKMQEEKKRMQVNQDMAVRMRTKITRISPSRRRTVPASLRTSPPSATATACPTTPRCQKQIQRKSSQAGWWKQRFWNSTSLKP